MWAKLCSLDRVTYKSCTWFMSPGISSQSQLFVILGWKEDERQTGNKHKGILTYHTFSVCALLAWMNDEATLL